MSEGSVGIARRPRESSRVRREPRSAPCAIVQAATHYQDPKVLLEVSEDLTGAMKGLAVSALDEAQMLQTRGW